MTAMTTESFNERIHAWIDDPEAPVAAEETIIRYVAAAHDAVDRAMAEAGTHGPECPVDHGRRYDVLVRIIGHDGASTVQIIPPGHSVPCVIGALVQDDTLANVEILGYRMIEQDDQVTEHDGVAVTSEVDGMVATWHPDEDAEDVSQATPGPEPRRRRSWLPWRR